MTHKVIEFVLALISLDLVELPVLEQQIGSRQIKLLIYLNDDLTAHLSQAVSRHRHQDRLHSAELCFLLYTN